MCGVFCRDSSAEKRGDEEAKTTFQKKKREKIGEKKQIFLKKTKSPKN